MSNLVDIELPFSGFYDSWHDQRTDEAVRNGFNYDYETGEEKEITDEVEDAIYMADIEWREIQEEYAKHYVEAFGDKFGMDLVFTELWMPKYYNFHTDRIFCQVPRQQIDKIRKEVEAHKGWKDYVKENFTSSDGFSSNYEDDITHEDWTKEILDEPQYQYVLKFWLDNVSEDTGPDGFDELMITEDFEMGNWDSVIKAIEAVEEYLKESK